MTPASRPPALSGAAATAVLGLVYLIPCAWLIGYLWPPINHDVASLMDVGHRWLSGEKLYVDIIDVNLPMVFAFYALPEVLSRWVPLLKLAPTTCLTLLFFVVIAISTLACRRLTHAVPSLAHPLSEWIIPPTLLFLFSALPNENFAQREHLMFIATSPYVLLAAARAEGAAGTLSRTMRVAVAIAAGLAFAQKPHFALVPLAVEAYLLLHRGWRSTLVDPVPWIVGLCIAGHLGAIWLLTPAYFDVVLPIIWGSYANLGEVSWSQILLGPVLLPTLVALAIFGALATFLSRTVAARAFVAYGLGAAATAAMQAKGWPYHVLPALSAAIFLAAVTLSQMVDRYLPIDRGAHRLPVAAIGATLLILLHFQAALFTQPFSKQRQFDDSISGVLLHVVERNAPNRRILVLSPGIYPHYPIINYAKARLTMRFQTMWVLQGIYADCEEFATLYNAPEDMSDAEKFVFDSVPDSFARERPDLLIVDRIAGVPRCQGRVFDYLEYFQRNAKFAAAFENYRHFMDVERYAIYKRR